MSWKFFKFERPPVRRRPIRRSARPRLEELEGRVVPSTDVTAYHQASPSPSPASTIGAGVNSDETILTPTNVNPTNFGKLFSTPVDGQVYAEPLYMENVNITTGANQGTHNVVFVATEHDSLYAIDANTGTILWQDALLTPEHGGTVSSIPNGAVNSSDINPEIGITATPVIDPTNNTIFVEAKEQEVANDGTHFEHHLYAINIGSGAISNKTLVADSIGDTYVSGPQVEGNGAGSINGVVSFDALRQHDRSALSLVNGNLYLAFASHGDNGPYHGWILGYSESTLALNAAFNANPNGSDTGIWMAGGTLPYETVNGHTYLYFETGNGTFETTLTQSPFNPNLMIPSLGDYGDSFVKVEIDGSTPAAGSLNATNNINGWGMHVADYFTPDDEETLNVEDGDLGSGAPLLLPASAGSAAHPNLMVGSGKQGIIYLIDRDNMGGYNGDAAGDGGGSDKVVQETAPGAINASFDTPTFYNGTLYYVGGYGDFARSFTLANGTISSISVSQSSDFYPFPGSTATISTDSSGDNAIVWDIAGPGADELRAYDTSQSQGYGSEIYTSDQAANSRDALGSAVKFSVPTVADGQVFVGTSDSLAVYGLLLPATVTSNPSNQTATVGQTATFTASASGSPRPTVQWQLSTDGGNTWANIAGANSTTLTLNGVQSSQNGDEFRAVFTNFVGFDTTSAATLTVEFAPKVASNPTNQTVTAGQTIFFAASANGNPAPTVQWQVSSDGGATWSNITSGGNSSTLTLNNVSFSMNGNEYRAVFTNSIGTATTSAATLTVQAPPAVLSNPSNQTVTAGQNATFTASASGSPNPTVQWQVSTDGGNGFTNISGATSPTLNLTNVLPSQNGYEYRAVFTNSVGIINTSAATLTVQFAPIVTTNPSSQTVTAGQQASFTTAANANPQATVQWQVSSDGGNSWTNVGGATSSTLTINNAAFSLNGYEYRADYTNSLGATPTTAATLTVNTLPLVTADPTNQTANVGQTATFTASAGGNPAPTLQWQVSTDGGKTFGNITGATSTTLTLANVQGNQNGYMYQAVFTNSAGTATTTTATLTVPFAPSVATPPSDQTVTAGQSATFTVTVSGAPTPTVQWEASTDGGKTFSEISGATSTTLTFSNVQASANGDEFEAVVTNRAGSVTSSVAMLTVQYGPTVTSNPTGQTATTGQRVSFTASANGNPAPTVQWQVSTDGGKTFTNINGAIGNTLSLINVSAAMNGNEYQAVFTNSIGSTTTSAATLSVSALMIPVVTGNPSSQTASLGGGVSFTASAVGNPATTVQWQISTDGGKTFSNIPGATSNTLTLGNITAAMNGYKYQAVFTNTVGTATSFVATLSVNATPPSPTTTVALHVPPLLAFLDALLGAVVAVDNANDTATITADLFGIPVVQSTYDISGNLVSATLFGINITDWVWIL